MPTSSRLPSVILLDDDPAVLKLLEVYMHRSLKGEVQLQSFTSPTEALAWMDAEGGDILVTDLMMPGMDGLEVLQKAKLRNAWTQVIFMTAHSTLHAITDAMEHGASDYLLKPVEESLLVSVVRQSMERCARWRGAMGQTLRKAAVR